MSETTREWTREYFAGMLRLATTPEAQMPCDVCEARRCGPMGCQCGCHEPEEATKSCGCVVSATPPCLTKREYFAGMALQGLLASFASLSHNADPAWCSQEAFRFADAMLNQETTP